MVFGSDNEKAADPNRGPRLQCAGRLEAYPELLLAWYPVRGLLSWTLVRSDLSLMELMLAP